MLFHIKLQFNMTSFIFYNLEEKHSKTLPQHHLSYVDKLTLRYFGNAKGEIQNEVRYVFYCVKVRISMTLNNRISHF